MNSLPKRVIVDVFELARSEGTASGALALRDAAELRESLADDDGAIEFSLHGFTDQHDRPCARLQATGRLALVCDRCAQRCDFDLVLAAEYRFVSSQAELDRIPVTVDDIEHLVGSRHFDVTQLVEEEAILAVPLSPRHADCRATVPEPLDIVENREQAPPESAQATDDTPAKPHPFAELAKLKRRLQ
jgi:uncharacterized protein